MNHRTPIEICANSYESALAAQVGGADRIELCTALDLGGLTPSFGLLSLCKSSLSVPAFVLIRPRGGDFCYSPEEIYQMEEDISLCGELGYAGVVFGALTDHSAVDVEASGRLLECAKKYGLGTTFHRAIDMSYSIPQALNDIISLGFDRILTSGGAPTAVEGAETIAQMVKMAEGRIRIMAGAGINSGNILGVLGRTNADEIHLSASGLHPSQIQEQYRKTSLSFTPEAIGSDYLHKRTDPQEVMRCVRLISE